MCNSCMLYCHSNNYDRIWVSIHVVLIAIKLMCVPLRGENHHVAHSLLEYRDVLKSYKNFVKHSELRFYFIFCSRYYFTKDKLTGVDTNAIHAGGRPESCCREPDAFIFFIIETAKLQWCPIAARVSGEVAPSVTPSEQGDHPSTQGWPPVFAPSASLS